MPGYNLVLTLSQSQSKRHLPKQYPCRTTRVDQKGTRLKKCTRTKASTPHGPRLLPTYRMTIFMLNSVASLLSPAWEIHDIKTTTQRAQPSSNSLRDPNHPTRAASSFSPKLLLPIGRLKSAPSRNHEVIMQTQLLATNTELSCRGDFRKISTLPCRSARGKQKHVGTYETKKTSTFQWILPKGADVGS
ncbi:unnamed protein product [Prunus armeniaca]|uniref:Uncharacterized protein n=1 Tax=Prunus armeniaca TaxID=36596 RepID=A0A6J5V725_PRUAR|nr:unnamed protein product [Prunus armeniaca]CAB4313964.1 unnamed protein product [Prunus armeniaca]